MNLLLDKTFLESVGITLDEDAYRLLADHYQETLMNRIEDELINELDEEQVIELSTLRDSTDQILQTWLAANVPQLREIIEDEIVILMGEIAKNSEQI